MTIAVIFLQNEFLDKNINLINTTGVGAANARNAGAEVH